MKKKFLSVLLCLCMVMALLPTTALAAGHTVANHPICGANCTDKSHSNQDWIGLGTTLPEKPGNYYLTTDVELSSTWTPADGTVLCLNGHSITTEGIDDYAILVKYGGTFTLSDCGGTGTITCGAGTNGCCVYEGSTFNMYGGSITGNTATYNGGGVRVEGTFNMYDGSITGNTTKYGGGVYVYDGTFNMSGGSITGNTATSGDKGDGGGVYVYNGTFNMSGGSITNNTATSKGGGVYVAGAGGTFTMSGGSITNNTATSKGGGGGVYVSDGTFEMFGTASITGNTANSAAGGGGVYVYDGTFNMYGGSITGNTTKHGGGVYVSVGTFNMSGGTIGGTAAGAANTAKDGNGGGVCVSGGTFKMSGTASITGNTGTFHGGGVYVAGGAFEMSGTASITGNNTATSNQPEYGGGGVYVYNGTFEMSETASITGNTAIGNGGGVYITQTKNGTATFTMSGGTITGNEANSGGGVFLEKGTFTMTDGSITGNTANSAGGGVYVKGDAFNMQGGSITDNTANSSGGGVCVSSGQFTMSGGKISDNQMIASSGAIDTGGGGVCVYSGTFTMAGDASITGNTASKRPGGGVYVGGGAFNMQGGTISGNTTTGSDGYGNGGGVYVEGGAFNMQGGSITGNTAAENGGGVYVDSNGSAAMTVSGGVNITGNKKGINNNNVYLDTDKTITVAGALTGEANSIGVTTKTAPTNSNDVKFATSASETDISGYINRFTPDAGSNYLVVYNEGDKSLYLKKHQHSWTYNPNSTNDTITANCAGCSTTETLTISASNTTYDGTAKPATLSDRSGFASKLKTVQVNYQKKTGDSTYDTTTTTAPTNAGTYKASITAGTGESAATASVVYTIGKKTPAAADFNFTKPGNLTYDGSKKQATVALKNTYSGCGDITVKYFKDGTEVNNATDAGTYTVKIAVTEGTNFTATTADLTAESWNFTITKNATPASAPTCTFSFDGANAGKLMGSTTAMEYSLNGGTSWTGCTENTNLTGADIKADKDIQVRVKETANQVASAVQTIDITAGGAAPSAGKTNCPSLTGRGSLTGVNSTMEYKMDGNSTWTAIEGDTTTVENLEGGTYYVRYKATGTTLPSAEQTLTIAPYVAKSDKAITSFKIGEAVGAINESAHTIAVTVPYGTNVTALTPTITVSDEATVSPASGAAKDFTSPVTYTVTAENGTQQEYTVTVTVELPKLNSVTPPSEQTLANFHTTAVNAAGELPTTVTITAESSATTLPCTWSCNGEYNKNPGAANTFHWTADTTGFAVNGQTVEGDVTITNRAAIQLIISAPTLTTEKTYDGNTTVNGAVTVGTLNGVLDGNTVTASVASAVYDSKNAGDRTITVSYNISGADAWKYLAPVNSTVSGKINPATVTLTSGISATNRAYNGQNTVELTKGALSFTGLVGSETLDVNIPATGTITDVNVGDNKAVTYSVTLADGNNDGLAANYTLSGTLPAVTVAITALDITGATVDPFNAMTYTGAAQTPVATVTKNGLTVTGTWRDVTNVGDLTTFTADGNFTGTITGQNPGMAQKIVDALDLSSFVTAPVNGDTPQSSFANQTQYTGTISWDGSPAKFLGNTVYTATLTLTATDNYTFTGVAANSFTYSGATVANEANSGTVTITFPATPNAAVSSIAIKEGASYKIAYKVGDALDVTGLTITATMDDSTTTDVNVTTGMVSGFSSSAVAASQTLTITYGGQTTTYIISVGKADQTIDAANVTAVYGDTGKSVSATNTTGEVDGKIPGALSYTVTAGDDVVDVDARGALTIKKAGTATVTVTAAETATCAEKTENVTVTVNKATITVTANNQSIYVNDAAPDLSSPVLGTHYTVTGLVGGDALVGTIAMKYQKDSVDTVPNVTTSGTYDIVISGAAVPNGNYNSTITYSSGTLTISARPVAPSGGGSYTPPTYKVESAVSKDTDGSVSFSKGSAKKGDTVTITVTPDRYYKVDDVTVKDKNGKEIAVTDNGDGTFTFKMPDSKVTVEPAFSWDNPFTDVAEDTYYAPAVEWALKNELTSGTGDGTTFSPNTGCTRAQIVTFLWRAAGCPEPAGMSSFTDVSADAYYAKAVAWAAEQGITSGTGDGKFSPDATCTRSQSMTFLYHAAGSPEVADGIAFSDVTADSYYAAAVAWATQNGVTNGTGDGTTFSPGAGCTRGQIMTFLYRWLVK